MKPVAALVVAGRLLLVGVGGDQRRVEIEHDRSGARPAPTPATAPARAPRADGRAAPRLDSDGRSPGTPSSPTRPPEQLLLIAQRAEVDTQSPPSASITHKSRTTSPGSCAERRSRVRASSSQKRLGQPHLVRHRDQQTAARVRHQARCRPPPLLPSQSGLRAHLQGDPPERGLRALTSRILPAQADVSGRPDSYRRAGNCTIRARRRHHLAVRRLA